jgi:ankyrin repeat protein
MSRPKQNSAALNALLEAIVRDDIRAAKKFFQANVTLAAARIDKDRLFQAGIFHWLYKGDTALHLAAAGYRTEIVGWLLEIGADPNAAHNRRKSGPLHYAADGYITGPAWDEKQQLRTIRRLLAAGAAIDGQDGNGATPLHRAVRTRCAAAVRLLLESGADPTLKNKPGSTPFHLAVQNTGRGGSGAEAAQAAQREIIAAFLERRVSTRLKDGKGKGVLDCARSDWIKELLTR